MNTDYQLRKDIDSVIELADYLNNLVEEAGVSSFKDLFANFTTKSDSELNKAILNTDLNKLSKDLDGLNDDLNLLNEDLYDAEGHLKVTEEDLNQAKESITALSNSLTQLDTDLNNAEADLEDIESELSTTKTNLNKALSDLTNLSNELSSAKNRITTAEGNITSANQSISNHQTSINNLNTELDDADSRLTATERDINSLRTSLTALDGSLTILADMLTGFTGTLQEFDAELVKQGIDKTELNEDIYKLVSQICLVRQDISDTDQKIDDTVTDINALDTSVVPNLKNKIDQAKASGDTAQSQLSQTKTDLENLNDAVFPNLVGAIDDAQASGDTAQSNLTQAISDINNVTAQGGTFANLHTSINNAQSAADDAQDNLDTSIADIENLTGNVFPNLKNHIETARDDIDDIIDPNTGSLTIARQDISQVQTDIGSVETDTNGDLQSQILTIVELFEGIVPIFGTVDVLADSEYVGSGIVSTGDYSATLAPSVDYVYETSTNKLYERQYLITQYPLGYYGEWVHISQLPSENVRFPLTQMYSLISQFFAELSHTHTKSEITDFAHTHLLSEIRDLPDNGWYPFPFNANAMSDSNHPMYERRWGNMVVIQGIGKLTYSLSANSSVLIGYAINKPTIPVESPWTGNNQQGYIIIDTDGSVTLYNRNGGSGTMSANTYFIINCTYMVD